MKIKMYTQPNCLYFKNVKDAFVENEIKYEEIDISNLDSLIDTFMDYIEYYNYDITIIRLLINYKL